ncbi:expressed unknown protein [Seminavis robusta]|uniref:Uncharacterized protein n=1 Tax=Seminavis robusta TaxID=568900 RepID=A0A9N8E9D1_9STRA|nr:expressed unknown protein [Seminavis robusta]|eukprot:Sro692_g188000.1 n/a (97) ;mRNA; f:8847-9137
MPNKQITFTPACSETNVSFVMMLDERDFAAKKQLFETGVPTDVQMQPYEMFKTTQSSISLVPATEMEVLNTFGSINGNKILEFMFESGNMNGKVAL